MKWIKERDALIAQTKAFVQSVTGRRPEETIDPPVVALSRIESVPTEAAVFIEGPIPADPLAAYESVERTERINVAPLTAPPARVLPQSDVRMEIQSRVAAFQAHQHRFHREREAYFKSVLVKVRSAIENGTDTPSA
jgi:hypothetical protein